MANKRLKYKVTEVISKLFLSLLTKNDKRTCDAKNHLRTG